MEYIFYMSLLVATATIFVVAIKGFLELMAPVRAAKREKALAASKEEK